MLFLIVSFSLIFTFAFSAGIPYVDKGYPYIDGHLPTKTFDITERGDKSPLHSVAFIPTDPGVYGIFFFIGGMDSLIAAETYTNYLGRIAGHGFVTIGVDVGFPVEAKNHKTVLNNLNLRDFADDFIKQYHWLEGNLNRIIENKTKGVSVDWNYSVIGSHSAGADGVLLMTERNNTIAKAVVYYEPFSYKFSNPINFTMPALIIGTKFAEEHQGLFPPCIIPGYGFNHFYDYWRNSERFLIEVKNFGHCDILDDDIRLFCDSKHICLTGNSSNINLYHDFAQGVTSSFLVYSLYGYKNDLMYLTDAKKMPIEVETLKYNLTSAIFP
ncbi:hypothetical protein LOTGIDRAFT_163441 [Lottia gigantea]|uniref:Chlorophyllase n=1 Tax=Lottia gigantea TaxID=225164 RepID=V4A9F2_LOTGI|nr:hypothetical protein LOTGIDRAFT_163441 [Lottia gigantea]ESO91710.1 hypothetical protein LOTGIDRAFT_163441 [Lottia gigantea]